MCRFIETIRIEGGQACHLQDHEKRMNRTRADVFAATDSLQLSDCLQAVENPDLMYKLRIVYDMEIRSAEYSVYQMHPVNSLELVNSDNIDYSYKMEDREAINALFSQKKNADDILIVKNGLLTDTSICNVALERDGRWYTPSCPLLCGTQRQRLLAGNVIVEKPIRADEIGCFSRISLFNAMIPFGKILIPIDGEHVVVG